MKESQYIISVTMSFVLEIRVKVTRWNKRNGSVIYRYDEILINPWMLSMPIKVNCSISIILLDNQKVYFHWKVTLYLVY